MKGDFIPIPRKGIYHGVVAALPPKIEGEVYYLWPEATPGEMEAPDEIAIFDTNKQALVSIYLYGFSYQQLLKLFPEYTSVQNVRNEIFPRSIVGARKLFLSLQEHPPRQLVDSEWVRLVKAIGLPEGKSISNVYIKYMEWVRGEREIYWCNPSGISEASTKIQERIDKKRAKIKELQDEIDKLEEKILGD